MRKLLYAAVSAVLLPTAVFGAAPSDSAKAKTEAPAARPAEAGKAADAPAIPAGWTLVTSPEGMFRAAFPSKPKMENLTWDTGAGNAQTISYGSKDDSGSLSVVVTKFPVGTMSQVPPTEALDVNRDNALARYNGKLVTDIPVRVVGPKGGKKRFFPGRDFEFIGNNGKRDFRASTRIIIREERIYYIRFMSAHTNETTEPFKQFLSTFSLQ